MNRTDRFLNHLDKSMSIIEIGPSHAPLVPKADGWNTTIVDHASKEDLCIKYARMANRQRIEDVDVIWSGGELDTKFPTQSHGTYHAIIASHVLEHMPDPIRFLKSCETLMKEDGKILLALPDKRHSFDLFGQFTWASEWLSAYTIKATVHSKNTAYNHVDYAVRQGSNLAWGNNLNKDELVLVHTLDQAIGCWRAASGDGTGVYTDYHAWRFTPASFQLLLFESAYIMGLDLTVKECTPDDRVRIFRDGDAG